MNPHLTYLQNTGRRTLQHQVPLDHCNWSQFSCQMHMKQSHDPNERSGKRIQQPKHCQLQNTDSTNCSQTQAFLSCKETSESRNGTCPPCMLSVVTCPLYRSVCRCHTESTKFLTTCKHNRAVLTLPSAPVRCRLMALKSYGFRVT
jgi:hypothetical protein